MKGQVAAIVEFDNTDAPINPDRFEQNMVYTGGLVTSVWFTDYTNTWTKSFTYSGGDLIKVSRWIKS